MHESFKLFSAILTVERVLKICLFFRTGYHFGCKSFLKRGPHLEAWAAHTHPKPTRVPPPPRGASSLRSWRDCSHARQSSGGGPVTRRGFAARRMEMISAPPLKLCLGANNTVSYPAYGANCSLLYRVGKYKKLKTAAI